MSFAGLRCCCEAEIEDFNGGSKESLEAGDASLSTLALIKKS
jgi:hypothetical protein